jgi:hypothetical protein
MRQAGEYRDIGAMQNLIADESCCIRGRASGIGCPSGCGLMAVPEGHKKQL